MNPQDENQGRGPVKRAPRIPRDWRDTEPECVDKIWLGFLLSLMSAVLMVTAVLGGLWLIL